MAGIVTTGTDMGAVGSGGLVTDLLRRGGKCRAERGTLESQWQEITEIMMPMRADFTVTRSMGEKRMQKVFDGTAGIASQNLAAGLYGNISSPSNDWFDLAHEDDDINDQYEVKTWLSIVAKRMRAAFGANGGKFYAKIMPLYRDLITLGTGVFNMEKIPGKAEIYYSCRHMAECYIAQNAYEQVDTMFRYFRMSGRNAAQRDNGSWDLPEAIVKANETEPDREWDFLHVTMPNEDFQRGMLGPRGKKFASIWIAIEHKKIVRHSGFPRFPYMAPRWTMPTVGPYGDSQAMLALSDVKMLNAFRKVNLVGLQKIVDPTLLSADEQAMRGWNTNPGGIVYGGLDEMGNARYKPLITGSRADIGVDYENQIRDNIREAFFHSLMLMIAKPGATATEVLAAQDEKLRLMGPNLGLVQSEFLDPVIDWQFSEMLEGGAFPPLPRALLDYPSINVRYVSPLARAQKAGEGAAIMRVLDALGAIGEHDPSVYDNIEVDETARILCSAFGAPVKMLRDPKLVEQIRKKKVDQQDVQSLTDSALPVSGAMKNMAQAQAAMIGARNPQQQAAA